MQNKINQLLESRPFRRILLGVLLFVFAFLLLNFSIHTVMVDNALGMDFHTCWQAARAIVFFDENPYGDTVAQWSQRGVFREIRTEGDQLGFAYPPYSLIPVIPLAFLDYPWAQSSWMAFFILIVMSVALTIAPAGKRLLTVFLFFLPYPIIFAIILGNFGLPVNVILILIITFLIKGLPSTPQQAFLGILLGWVTIKPQAVWLFVIAILWISWQKKFQNLIIWFAGSLMVYILFSFLIVPDWPIAWLKRITEYHGYVEYSSPHLAIMLQQFLPTKSSNIIFPLALLVLLISTLWIIFKHSFDSKRQVWLIGWVALITYLVHPTLFSYVQITLLIPLILWVFQGQNLGIFWRASFVLLFSISTWLVTFWIGPLINTPFQDEINTLLYIAWLIGLSINLLVSVQKPLPDQSLEKIIPV